MTRAAIEDVRPGWVKLHRKTLSDPLFRAKYSEWFLVWIHILLSANHEPSKAIIAGEEREILPGQVLTSRKAIAVATETSESLVERALVFLKSGQRIDQKSFGSCRVITVTNWARYQRGERDSEQPADNERTTSGQRADTSKNVKNVKKGKKGKKAHITVSDLNTIEIPFYLDGQDTREALAAWLEHKEARGEIYQGVAPVKAMVTDALKTRASRDLFIFAIRMAIKRNWKGVEYYPSVIEAFNAEAGRQQPQEKSRWQQIVEAEARGEEPQL